MSRRGGWGGILRGLGQQQSTKDTPDTQIKIPNLATLWRILWMCLGWTALFSLILPFGIQWLWGIFNHCRNWRIVHLLNVYSWWWTMPTFFDVLLPIWRLFPVLVGFEVLDATFGIRKRFKREVKHPTWPPPFKAIHPAEYTDEPGQEPGQWEPDGSVEQDVPESIPTESHRHVINHDDGSKHIVGGEWEDHNAIVKFAQAVAGGKNFSVSVSRWYGVTPTDYDTLKNRFITLECFDKKSIGPKLTLKLKAKGRANLRGIGDTPTR